MYQINQFYKLKILYGGKAFGNLDFNYGSKKVVAKNHEKLLKELNSTFLADIRSKGGNSFIDIDNTVLTKNFNFFECDGLITSRKDVALSLFPADCIPLVICSSASHLKALIHVGRKGAELEIISRVIHYIIENKNEKIENIYFYFGPSIHKDSYSYEKIDEKQLSSMEWKQFIEKRNDKYHIDLIGFSTNKLKKNGSQ